jgi:acyl-ACP thioesterase
MIDTESRQPTDIFSIDNGAINNWIVKDKECPIEKGGRVKMSDGAELMRTIDTNYNDVDINGHINSVKYIEHILDLWPLDWYRTHQIRRFEIAYVAEAHAGDSLSFFMEPVEESQQPSDISPSTISNIRIVKSTPDGPVEVCRSKVVFNCPL